MEINLTPSWQEILPALLLLLDRGSPEAQRTARAELKKMARLADERVASLSPTAN